ncbi:Oligopeptide transporter OPT superfamily protein [Desulfatibacillum aliphaticivorans]|uniref:Oligopeptide transporter OPT superfamily protein n=1 Tax=Desulfatibacillum aliphaticivorans TaxID=218208 RepID=B8FHK4_DESAL|nr:peptide transporter [Desulfatibacillum aliphaticivorans]ACL02292.1 Oligopeptide transporter OPT superfamily protein [Desulfatibacillum aliphaticivorans]
MYEDKELQEYRDLLKPPSHFEEGFDWKTIVGAIFIGFLMMPGSMYLQLVIGTGIGPAARWVTIILFAEIAKRSYTELKQQEVFLLYYMAGAALASPFQGLLWSQYLVQSDAARMLGLVEYIPSWVAPGPDSSSLVERTFFHRDWLTPILLLAGAQLIQRIDHFGLGYTLYRITSDVEKLPFPMAPVGALGTMALAESTEDRKTSWKWRVFSIGGMIGLGFGAIYVLLPIVSGLLFAKPIRLIPIPWVELTGYTEQVLPAVATGIQLDIGLIFIGMVLPFWAVIGGLVGLIITIILNPILHSVGILHRWHPGMGTVDTVFANNFDFYMSFGIGLGLAIAAVGVWHVVRSFGKSAPGERGSWKNLFNPPEGRGDFSIYISLGIYVFSTLAYVLLCVWLVPTFPWIFFLAYGFIYTPVVSYVSARMEGIAGQFVSLPLVREASFIAGARFFGYSGIEIWYAPIPIHNYGEATVHFRQIELTGTSLRGIIKAEIVVFPVVIIASLLFSQFIWRLAPIPSSSYPYAQELWHLQALNSLLMQTSTLEGNSLFFQALRGEYVAAGMGFGVLTYFLLMLFGLPIMLIYGVVRGLGQSTPHGMLLEVAGALLGRFFFLKKYGKSWRQYAPVLLAGFSCGMGLTGMFAMGFALILKSLGRLAY